MKHNYPPLKGVFFFFFSNLEAFSRDVDRLDEAIVYNFFRTGANAHSTQP